MKRVFDETKTENKQNLETETSGLNELEISKAYQSIGPDTSENQPKIGIVGGGLMGLVLAYRISKLGAQVKVLESESQTGGLSTYYDFGNFQWDKFYHIIMPNDASLIRLFEEVGLEDQLNWNRAYTGYYANNSFYPLNSAKEFLLFPLLNLWDKIRLVYTIFYGSRISNWQKLEKVTVKEWLVRMSGKKNFEKFWSPLLLAKLGDNYKRVSGVFIWTYIRRLFKAREHPVNKDYMGYVNGGYKTLFNRLEELLNENQSSIELNVKVERILSKNGAGIEVQHSNTTEIFDKVIFTAPSSVLEKVTTPELCEVIKKDKPIEYMGVICLVLTTRKAITPFYVLNLGDGKTPFTGVIGISTLVDLEQTAGEYLTYFPKYIPANHPYWAKSDEELKEVFLSGMRHLYPNFSEEDILSVHLNRAFKVQPLHVINYSELIPEIKTKHPDFFVLNTSQFVNSSVNNNIVVEHVNEFMHKFEDELKIAQN
ncbi:MAG: NAD(P)-binding protein [Eudoraea sp.]|nr:NAD(P)-binding protein [Eudoraea sp.]